MSIHLVVIVEGQTEEAFFNLVLVPELNKHYSSLKGEDGQGLSFLIECSVVKTSKGKKGGGDWKKWQKHIKNILQSKEPGLFVSTMFDLYGMPPKFPNREYLERILNVNDRIEQIQNTVFEIFNSDHRLIPYVQKYEFEALVFTDLDCLIKSVETRYKPPLRRLWEDTQNIPPEDINDSPNTHPAKRIEDAFPEYEKPIHGPVALDDIVKTHGFLKLREKCPRFGAWISRLENLHTIVDPHQRMIP